MDELLDRYAERYGIQFIGHLGEGKDGTVLHTAQRTAVKFLLDQSNHNREVRAYRLLTELRIDEICGHRIPQLMRVDDDLRAIEMTIVRPPFLVDFVSAYTDEEIEWFNFTDDVLAEREESGTSDSRRNGTSFGNCARRFIA